MIVLIGTNSVKKIWGVWEPEEEWKIERSVCRDVMMSMIYYVQTWNMARSKIFFDECDVYLYVISWIISYSKELNIGVEYLRISISHAFEFMSILLKYLRLLDVNSFIIKMYV